MTNDNELTPVLFRADVEGDTTHITAVFPTEPGTMDFSTMSCFAHVGQHGSCNTRWLRHTRPAFPYEYADLKRELEAMPYGYRLKVYARVQEWMHESRHMALQS